MSDEEALLQAIYANPDEDTPRLVYADWLQENGNDERAEFIRVECQAERTDRNSPIYLPLLRRSSRLLADNKVSWFGPLSDEDIIIMTRRGFIEGVAISADSFVAFADALGAYAPLLRDVHANEGSDWRAFFASPLMPAIRRLSFADGIFGSFAAEELAASENITALVDLNLDRQPLGYAAMEALAEAPLRGLEKLSVAESEVEDGVATVLFTNRSLANLRELDLSENGLTDETCSALAAADFGRLERLALCNNHITADGIAALARASHLARLRSLNLYANPVGPDGGRAILASRYWTGLTELNLIACGVGIAVVEDLRWVYGGNAVKA